MGRCLVLVGLLAAAVGALVACDGAPLPPVTSTAPADGPWRVFVGDEGIAARHYDHDSEHRRTQVGTRPTERWTNWRILRSRWERQLRLELRASDREDAPAWGALWPSMSRSPWFIPEPWIRNPMMLRGTIAELVPAVEPRTATGFRAEPHVRWRDVDTWWELFRVLGPRTRTLRIGGALVLTLTKPLDATGRVIEVVTDDAVTGPFPPVTIRSGGAEFRFPGGDPYATKDNVEAANRSWRALTAALRDPAAGRARPADLAIGSRVPWAHVAQLLATLADVGITRLRMPDRPYGLELRFAGLSGASLDDLAAWDFPRPSPWPWIGAGLALAGLLGVVAWAPWGRARRRRSVSDRATR